MTKINLSDLLPFIEETKEEAEFSTMDSNDIFHADWSRMWGSNCQIYRFFIQNRENTGTGTDDFGRFDSGYVSGNSYPYHYS